LEAGQLAKQTTIAALTHKQSNNRHLAEQRNPVIKSAGKLSSLLRSSKCEQLFSKACLKHAQLLIPSKSGTINRTTATVFVATESA